MILGMDFVELFEGDSKIIKKAPIGIIIGGRLGPGKPMPKMKAHVDTIAFSKAVGFELSSVIDVPGKKT